MSKYMGLTRLAIQINKAVDKKTLPSTHVYVYSIENEVGMRES
ncbi:hypothetical protein Q8W40_21135 [Vibrio penaeicida]|nr:hypothetical protein [Vibrio penaeicida]MDP2574708.1 hypothetical protein [Vibrio penaeicida]